MGKNPILLSILSSEAVDYGLSSDVAMFIIMVVVVIREAVEEEEGVTDH